MGHIWLCDLARGHRSLRYEAGRSARAVGELAPSAGGFCGGDLRVIVG